LEGGNGTRSSLEVTLSTVHADDVTDDSDDVTGGVWHWSLQKAPG
jgi:hypothetical protein